MKNWLYYRWLEIIQSWFINLASCHAASKRMWQFNQEYPQMNPGEPDPFQVAWEDFSGAREKIRQEKTGRK